jgi:hypothetical protein
MRIRVQAFRDCDECGRSVTEKDQMLCAVCRATIRARIAIDRAKSFKHKHFKIQEVSQ